MEGHILKISIKNSTVLIYQKLPGTLTQTLTLSSLRHLKLQINYKPSLINRYLCWEFTLPTSLNTGPFRSFQTI